MKPFTLACVLSTFALFTAFTSQNVSAHGHASHQNVNKMAENISVNEAWARATFALAKTGAVYMTIHNDSQSDVSLIKASVAPSTAAMTQIHHTIMKDEMMVMQELEEGITIAKGQSISLAPGGLHIMLMGLTGPLKAGESVDLTLYFSDESTLLTKVPVKDVRGNAMHSGTTH